MDLAGQSEKDLLDTAAKSFEIIPSYFEKVQQQAIAAETARLVLKLAPLVEKSPEVRGILERYAALNIVFPYQ